MEEAKPASTPGYHGKQLSTTKGTLLPNPTEYKSLVGALQYAAIARPDIAFVVNMACRFMSQPRDAHWKVVKCILRYLKGTLSLGLLFQPSSILDLQGYSDVDWASCPDDICIISGFYVFLGGNLVSWTFVKQ